MLEKILLITMLGFSIPCFADGEKGQLDSSENANRLMLPAQSSEPATKQIPQSIQNANSAQKSDTKKQSPMIEYCREHTC